MPQIKNAGEFLTAHTSKRQQEATADLERDLQRSKEEADKLRLTAARVPGLQTRLAAFETKADETSKRHEVRGAAAVARQSRFSTPCTTAALCTDNLG